MLAYRESYLIKQMLRQGQTRNKPTAPRTNLLPGDKHAVDLADGHVGGHAGLVVHVAIALALSQVVGRYLAGQDVPEQGERVVQSLGVPAT